MTLGAPFSLWKEEAFERWDPEVFLQENLGDHTAPNSPLVSVALNILHADLWIRVAELLRQLCPLMEGRARARAQNTPSRINLEPLNPKPVRV